MRFDKLNAYAWIDEIVAEAHPSQPFLQDVCRSLFSEDALVKLPQMAVIGTWTMNANGMIELPTDAHGETDYDQCRDLMVPRKYLVTGAGRRRLDESWYAEIEANPDVTEAASFVRSTFRFAGGAIPKTGYGVPWTLRHLYDGSHNDYDGEHFCGQGKPRLNAIYDAKHFSLSIGLVAVHPLANQLWTTHPCIVYTLRARAFVQFAYDPDQVFYDSGTRDGCGVVSFDGATDSGSRPAEASGLPCI